MPLRPGVDRRRGLSKGEPPRMRQLFDAVIATSGDLPAMAAKMSVSPRVLAQRVSILRGRGLARQVNLYDPRRVGRPCEVLARVRMDSYAPADLARFEALLVADATVTSAVWVSGRDDYRLTAFHSDLQAAQRWARALAEQPAVKAVEWEPVRTLHGDQIDGALLRGREELIELIRTSDHEER